MMCIFGLALAFPGSLENQTVRNDLASVRRQQIASFVCLSTFLLAGLIIFVYCLCWEKRRRDEFTTSEAIVRNWDDVINIDPICA
jgi:hypothetical protein